MKIRIATLEDVAALQLRKEDAREVSPGWRERVAELAQQGQVWAAVDGAEVLALQGITTGPGLLSPWLLCGEGINRYRKEVMRRGRSLVERLREEVRKGAIVSNYIPREAKSNRRFVQALGFRIVPAPAGGRDAFFLPNSHV